MAKKSEIPELRKLRDEYDAARQRLLAGIHKYFRLGHGPAEIGRSVDWSDKYVAKIRDDRNTAAISGAGMDREQGTEPSSEDPSGQSTDMAAAECPECGSTLEPDGMCFPCRGRGDQGVRFA